MSKIHKYILLSKKSEIPASRYGKRKMYSSNLLCCQFLDNFAQQRFRIHLFRLKPLKNNNIEFYTEVN